MSKLAYVTGISGAGKSTVRAELRRRGYLAYDTDEDHLSRYFENSSGDEVALPADPLGRDDRWYIDHTQRVPADTIHRIRTEAGDRPVFICGTMGNEAEVWDQFSVVVNLSVDAETIRRRLARRSTNQFGKTADELDRILGWHATTDETYERFGAVRIDATRPVRTVVDDLLRKTRQVLE